MAGVWGPDGADCAVAVTFDHLGEAAEIQLGSIPPDAPVGRHHSVTRELPALLAMLEAHSYSATFFVEAWNFRHYPEAVRAIAEAGHEVGWHGWLHEPWHRSSAEEIDESLRLSLDAFGELGIRPRGARPPAGLLGPHSVDILAEHGFDYVSLAGTAFGTTLGKVARLPLLSYPWHAVDGAYYVPGFTRLRRPPGEEPVGPGGLLAGYAAIVEDTVADGGCVGLIFHVPWQDSPERIAAIGTLVDRLAADERVWLARADEIAGWVRAHPADFPEATHVDRAPAW